MREKNAHRLLKSEQNDLALQKNGDLKWLFFKKKKAIDCKKKLFGIQTVERRCGEIAEKFRSGSPRLERRSAQLAEEVFCIHKEKSLNLMRTSCGAINRDETSLRQSSSKIVHIISLKPTNTLTSHFGKSGNFFYYCKLMGTEFELIEKI